MTLLELLQLLRKHIALVVVLPIACAVGMGVVAYGFMSNEYTASMGIYVLADGGDDQSSLSTTLSASQLVANDAAVLIQSDRVLADAAAELGLESLAGYSVSVSSQTTNRFITLTVTGPSPQMAADIATAITKSAQSLARDVLDISALNPLDAAAAVPEAPSGPNRPMYVAVAFLAGLFLAVAIVVLIDMLNTKVRSIDEVEKLLGIPVIGRMPLMKGGK
jgi:capsular polysaccharide biosynthesis protein